MLRVYFDKQIITYLQKSLSGKEDIYKQLLKLLEERKNEFWLPYSVAHFMDFAKDLSHYKDIDLKFMDKIGFNYFIRYDSSQRDIYITNELPSVAYWNGNFDTKLTYKIRKESPIFRDQQMHLKSLYNRYFPLLKAIEGNPAVLKIMSPDKADFFNEFKAIVPFNSRDITERKFIKYVQKYYLKIKSSPKNELRSFMNDLISGSKSNFKIPAYKLDFSKRTLKHDLHNSELQSFFVECMIGHMNSIGYANLEQVNDVFSLHTFYTFIELTGLISEKPSKLNVQNMVADSGHAVFACYCDVLVT